MKAMFLSFKREMNRLFKNRKLCILLFAWPFLFASFLASIYTEKVIRKMPIALCDEDNSSISRLAARYLNDTRSLDLSYRVSSPEEIKQLLLEGKIEGGIYIPRGFAADMKRNIQVPLIAYVNGGNMVIGNMIMADVKTIAGTISAGVRIKYLEKTGSSVSQAGGTFMPVGTENFRLFNPGGNYMRFLVPGLWGAILQQIFLTISALALASEKEKNTLKEALTAAGRPSALLAGKLLAYAALFFAVLDMFEFAMFPFFGIPVKSAGGLVLANLLFSLSVTSAGLMISAIAPTETDSLKGVLIIGAPAFILSGYIWPLEYMPSWIAAFASIIPLMPYLKAMRPLAEYGCQLADIIVPLLSMTGMAAVYFCIAAILLSRERPDA